MIFADKITDLRKRNGWSQEDLAVRMNVSRQAVAKWESTQSVPSLDKILQLSALFGVSTDYLLKDDLEEVVYAEEENLLPSVSLEQAHSYLNSRRSAALRLMGGTALCILSPVVLIALVAGSEFHIFPLAGTTAAAIGLVVLIVMVAAAVGLFIWEGECNKKWKYLDEGSFQLDYGVRGMVREQQQAFARTRTLDTITGVLLCILAVIPIFAVLVMQDSFLSTMMVCLLLLIVAIGVSLLIFANTIAYGMDRLLQEGDFSPEAIQRNKRLAPLATSYWLIATAVYLVWSFTSQAWQDTWVVWPAAGVLYAAVLGITRFMMEQHTQSHKNPTQNSDVPQVPSSDNGKEI